MKIQLRVVYGNLKFLQYAEKSFTCIICYVSTWRIKQSEMGIAFHSSIHQSFVIFVRLVVKIVVIASLSSSSVSIFDIHCIGFHIELELYLWIFFCRGRGSPIGLSFNLSPTHLRIVLTWRPTQNGTTGIVDLVVGPSGR